MKNNYIFKFNEVVFDTNDGGEDDPQVAHLLNAKFGKTVYNVRAESQEAALKSAIDHLTEVSGFRVIDADYDFIIT